MSLAKPMQEVSGAQTCCAEPVLGKLNPVQRGHRFQHLDKGWVCRSTSSQTGHSRSGALPSKPCHYSRASGSFNPQRAVALSVGRLQQSTNCNCASARMKA